MSRETAPWAQMASGGPIDLLDPKPEQIKLGDIAYQLAGLNRFNGATRPYWSVAVHSVLVGKLVEAAGHEADVCLAALLHDAHEACIGDLTSPVQAAVANLMQDGGAQFKNFWNYLALSVQKQVHMACGLPAMLPSNWLAVIRVADLQALDLERKHVMAPAQRDWDLGKVDYPPGDWDSWVMHYAQRDASGSYFAKLFIDEFRLYYYRRHGLV